MTGATINGFLHNETATFLRVIQRLFPDCELASIKMMETAKLADTVKIAAIIAGPSLSAPEGQRTERQPDETGVGIGSGCGIDGGIDQIFRFQPVKGEHPEKDDENPQFERVEEFGLVQLGP